MLYGKMPLISNEPISSPLKKFIIRHSERMKFYEIFIKFHLLPNAQVPTISELEQTRPNRLNLLVD